MTVVAGSGMTVGGSVGTELFTHTLERVQRATAAVRERWPLRRTSRSFWALDLAVSPSASRRRR